MKNYLFNVEKIVKNEADLSNLWKNICGKKWIVYQAENLVFGHYSYQFDSK